MRPSRRTLLALACAASVVPVHAGAAPKPPLCRDVFKDDPWRCDQTQLLSRHANGTIANGATPATGLTVPDLTSPAMALDGLSVAFSSAASNLVAGDTNGVADIFVRKTQTDAIVRASTDAKGRQANGASYSPALSVDGLKLAFVSAATNLVAGDTNGVPDVFFKDLRSGAIRRVSVRADGTQANGPSNNPFVSLFGDWVTFDSDASNLSSNDTNGLSDAHLWTRATGAIRRLAVPARLDEAANEEHLLFEGVPHTGSASISHDGSVIAYHRLVERASPSEALPALDAGETLPLAADVFVEAPRVWEKKKLVPVNPMPNGCTPTSAPKPPCWRWQPGRWHGGTPIGNDRGLQRIVMAPWGGTARKMLERPIVTANGAYIAFEAWSAITPKDTLRTTEDRSALARNDLGAACLPRYGIPASQTCLHTDYRSIYLFDWWLETHFPVSTKVVGALPTGDCYDPSPNATGTVVAFTCSEYADNLVPGDTNQAEDVFVKDMPGRATTRVSMSRDHGEGFGGSSRPSISYEGRRVAFASGVPTFVGGDTNGVSDVFLRDRRTDLPNRVPILQPRDGQWSFDRIRALDIGEPFSFRLRATDPDAVAHARSGSEEPLDDRMLVRYGSLTPLPDGASIDPVTGLFRWTPGPDQTEAGGKRWPIILWAGDGRGSIDPETLKHVAEKGTFPATGNLQLVTLYVRDPGGTARCDAHTLAPELIEGACNPVD